MSTVVQYLNENGLSYLWTKIQGINPSYNNTNSGLTATTMQDAIDELATGSSAVPSSITPLMDGSGSVGTSTAYARADHVHPSEMEEFTNAEIDTITSTATTPWNPDFTEAAKWIVEQYTGTSLYGSSQTIEDAFAAVSNTVGMTENVNIASHLTPGTGITIISAFASYNSFFCSVRVRCKKTDETAFAVGRVNPLFTFDSSFNPSVNLTVPVISQTSIGGAMTGVAYAYCTTTACIVDIPTSNVKELSVCFTYAR